MFKAIPKMDWSRFYRILFLLANWRRFDQNYLNCHDNFTKYNDLTIAPVYLDVRQIDLDK